MNAHTTTAAQPQHLRMLSMPLYGVLLVLFLLIGGWDGLWASWPIVLFLLGIEYLDLYRHSCVHHPDLWLAENWVVALGVAFAAAGATGLRFLGNVGPFGICAVFAAGQFFYDSYFHDREHRRGKGFHRPLSLLTSAGFFAAGLAMVAIWVMYREEFEQWLLH